MRETQWVGLLVLLTFVTHSIPVFMFDNYFVGDATARYYTAYNWCVEPNWVPHVIWLPLHFYFLGSVMWLTNDVEFAPRLLTVFAASIALLPLYYTSRLLVGAKAAKWVGWLYVFLPVHIFVSSITLSDAFFLLFLLSSIFFFLSWLKQGDQTVHLTLTVVFIAAACLVRFEGWIYAFSMSFCIIFLKQQKNLFKRVAALVALSIPMLAVCWYSYQRTGNPLIGFMNNEIEVASYFKLNAISGLENMADIPLAFCFYPLLFLFPGLIRKWQDARCKVYLFIIGLPIALALFKVSTLTLIGEVRYFTAAAVLLLPFSAGWLAESKLMQKMKIRVSVILLLVVMHVISFSFLYADAETRGHFCTGFRESAAYVKRELNPQNTSLYLDQYRWQNSAWAVFSDNLFKSVKRTEHGIYGWITGRYWVGERFDAATFLTDLSQKEITHIVLFKQGELGKGIGFSDEYEEFEGVCFKRVFAKGEMLIYEVL